MSHYIPRSAATPLRLSTVQPRDRSVMTDGRTWDAIVKAENEQYGGVTLDLMPLGKEETGESIPTADVVTYTPSKEVKVTSSAGFVSILADGKRKPIDTTKATVSAEEFRAHVAAVRAAWVAADAKAKALYHGNPQEMAFALLQRDGIETGTTGQRNASEDAVTADLFADLIDEA